VTLPPFWANRPAAWLVVSRKGAEFSAASVWSSFGGHSGGDSGPDVVENVPEDFPYDRLKASPPGDSYLVGPGEDEWTFQVRVVVRWLSRGCLSGCHAVFCPGLKQTSDCSYQVSFCPTVTWLFCPAYQLLSVWQSHLSFFKGLMIVATWLSVHVHQSCGVISPASVYSSHPTFCVLQLPRGFLSSYHLIFYLATTWFSIQLPRGFLSSYHVVFFQATPRLSFQL
jgi:hypothetical protein